MVHLVTVAHLVRIVHMVKMVCSVNVVMHQSAIQRCLDLGVRGHTDEGCGVRGEE